VHITEVVANRLELDYNEDKDGETFLISTISDEGKTQLCRINLDNIPQLKNFTDLALQFMSKCKQEREQRSQIASVRPRVEQ
jgi:hypothetical protein